MKTLSIHIILVLLGMMFWAERLDAQAAQFNAATGDVQGRYNVGGLVGRSTEADGRMIDNYAIGSVAGQQYVGGLIGINAALVRDCYSVGPVFGNAPTGGFIGNNTGQVSGSYWDMQKSGQSTSSGGSGRSTDEMTYPYAANTFVNWNFETVWKQDILPWANQGYPFLQPTEVYRLDLKVYPGGSGTVTGSGYYKANTEVSIVAVPNQDFKFVGWMLDGIIISTQPLFGYILPSHKSLTAVFQENTTSLDESSSETLPLVRVYPNPATDELNIDLLTVPEQVRSVSLVNILGQTLRTDRLNGSGQRKCTFYIKDLAPGLYGVVIDYGSRRIVAKAIIQ